MGREDSPLFCLLCKPFAFEVRSRKRNDLIFKPYTFKQWNKYPLELGPEVLQRIPVRSNCQRRVTRPFLGQLLSSPLITMQTGVDYFDVKSQFKCDKIYFTGPIDAYFADQNWDKLEYRSLEFERVVQKDIDVDQFFQSNFIVNHPQDNVDYTRIVEYKHLYANPESPHTIYFLERSKDGGEPYYPVPNEKNKALCGKYQALAQREPNVAFVGRLASYKYFNMDQAIKNALEVFAQSTGLTYDLAGDGVRGAVESNKFVSYAGKFAGPNSSCCQRATHQFMYYVRGQHFSLLAEESASR